jgi:exonuclease SbcC
MIVKKLFLKNFKSYGADNGSPIEIDLSNYDKLAIVGNNGAGKSTLIDAMTFALFGKALASEIKEVGSRELVNDNAKEAYVKFVFEKDGIEYEVERSLRSSNSIAHLIIDGVPSGQTGSKAINEAITRILGMDYDTFVSSTIVRQDEMDKLTAKTPAKRKEALMNIFGLNVYEMFAERSKDKMRSAETNVRVNEATIKEKASIVQKEPELKNRVKSLRRDGRKLSAQLLRIDRKINDITKKRDEYQLKKVDFEKTKTNFEGKETALKREREILSGIKTDIKKAESAKKDLSKLEPKLKEYKIKEKELEDSRKIKEEYDKAVKNKELAKTSIDAEMKRMKSHLSLANTAITKLSSEKSSKIKELKEVKNFSKVSNTKISKTDAQIQNLRKQKEDSLQKLATVGQQIRQAKSQLREMKENKSKIQKQKSNECPVCKQSLKRMTRAQLLRHYATEISKCGWNLNKLLKYQTKMNVVLNDLTKNLTTKENFRKELLRLGTKIGRIPVLERSIKSIKKNMKEKSKERKELITKLAKNQYSLKERERLDVALKIINKLNFNIVLFRKLEKYISRNKGIEGLKAKLEEQSQRLPSLMEEFKTQEGKIAQFVIENRQLKANLLELKPFADKYEKFESLRKEEETDRSGILQKVTACKTQISETENQLTDIQRTKSEIKTLQRKIRQEALEMLFYKKLHEEIFGKDGIPTEILREIIPEIENESSEILGNISNGRFLTSVGFSGKDEISIRAVDINGEHPVFRFSGGEKMKINLALRLGVSEVVAKRKGSKGRLETLVVDEGFGQLDTEGRRAVVDVINSLMERFKKIIVISHVEDIKEAFDTKLLVENIDGYSKVRFVS